MSNDPKKPSTVEETAIEKLPKLDENPEELPAGDLDDVAGGMMITDCAGCTGYQTKGKG